MKCAIVGCGVIAVMHAEGILKNKANHLVAVADCDFEKAKKFAEEYVGSDCKAYSSLEEMCEKEEIEVLHICTPHDLHVPMALYAFQRNLHVFMEKPPAITREQFQLLEKAKTEKQLGICFQNRLNPGILAIQKMLKEPTTGRLKGARAFVTWSRPKEYYTESSWRGTKSQEGGGVLINQAIHTLDLLVHLIGNPIWSEATLQNHHLKGWIEVEDTLEAYIQFEQCPACFFATTAFSSNAPVLLELECENVTIRLEGTEVTTYFPNGKKETVNYHREDTLGKDYWGSGHTACIQEFYDCLKTGKQFSIGLSEVKDTFYLMLDIYQSTKVGKPIEFHRDWKLTGFADEIDVDFDIQIKVLQELHMSYLELRSAYGKNISLFSLKEAKELKEKLDEKGIKVSALASPIGKINITDGFEEHFQLFCHVVKLAKLFETKYIRIFSFYIPEDQIAESYRDEVFHRLHKMICYARDEGIVLLHENEKGIYGDTVYRCKELMETLYCDNFQLIFDFANFVQCGQNALEAYQHLKPYITYLHIKDAIGNRIVPPGQGDGHIAEIVKLLQEDNYQGFYSLEPHLIEFNGLKQLERETDQSVIEMSSTAEMDGSKAFQLAYEALKRIMEDDIWI